MAKVDDNLITEGLSGKLGKRLVFRKGRGGRTILTTRRPHNNEREYSDAELAHQNAFKTATGYAKVAKDNPLYVKLAKDAEATSYNFAVADWFGHPEVLDIDPNGWTGQIGQTIRIQAQDDTRVISVHVRIESADGTVQEQGQAVPSETDALWWVYTTKSQVSSPTTSTVVVTAKDLPGNSSDWSGKIVS
jgi:hypothetical protein